MKRRDLLKGLAIAPFSERLRPDEQRQTSNTPPAGMRSDLSDVKTDPDWVLQVRGEMPVTREVAYLQTASFGPSPVRVVSRVRELMEHQLKGPAVPVSARQLQEAEDDCRPLVARFLGARQEEVTLAHNTTEGLNIVLWSMDWKPGDEIILSNQEHPALLIPSYNLLSRFKVNYRRASIDLNEDVVASVLKQVSPRTRLVAISHVSRRSGRVIPARELASALHSRGIRLLLDGAQAAGNIRFRFDDLGADYYSLCGHKWLLGPKGTAALLIRKDLLEKTPVSYTGAHSQKSYDEEGHLEWHPDGRRFEYGTRAQFNFGGFAEALRWLESIGTDEIFDRIQRLSLQAGMVIRSSKKFELASPLSDSERSGIVVVRLPAGSSGEEVFQKLAQLDRIVVSPLEDPRNLRISLHFFNTWKEFETLMSRLDHYC
ncbi:MAG: aminotransferase class V-fold PLP-dependent enzyme [Acidimicrobiia bacterium]|nr:aminotransferase class V-fold PLP-dependent enzyme [Acidimicrobiia bacterium]